MRISQQSDIEAEVFALSSFIFVGTVAASPLPHIGYDSTSFNWATHSF